MVTQASITQGLLIITYPYRCICNQKRARSEENAVLLQSWELNCTAGLSLSKGQISMNGI